MTPYIVNLTNQIIRDYGFDTHVETDDREKFIENTQMVLESYYGPIKKYNFETLGKIIFFFETGNPGCKIFFTFDGLPGKALRRLVAKCLALAICERLMPTQGSTVPPFARKK